MTSRNLGEMETVRMGITIVSVAGTGVTVARNMCPNHFAKYANAWILSLAITRRPNCIKAVGHWHTDMTDTATMAITMLSATGMGVTVARK